ncbi:MULTISPECIES: hypothetical protein [Microbacterium]|nr:MULTISPECIES: hypothetical protein [Microbacterium]
MIVVEVVQLGDGLRELRTLHPQLAQSAAQATARCRSGSLQD